MRFEFIADRPVLDFLPTLAARGTVEEEKLQSDADLVDWIEQSELVDAAAPVRPGDLERARTVREALFGVVAAAIDGRPVSTADRRLANDTAAAPPPRLWLDEAGLHREGDLDAVLSALARDALDLTAGPDRDLLHWCGDPSCTRPFVDRSRGHRRRWCGMRGCGDRAKAAAYRARRRGRPSGS